MKRNFTRILAALALLIFTMPSLVAWGQTRTEVVYGFSQIDFTGWTNSYAEHVVEYDDATVTFAAASKQTQTITDIPVTKGQPVSLVLNNLSNQITSATFVCRQWGSKAQTITLHYSTNGGTDYTSTNITSSNFTISSSSLPEGTNALKITFSSTSNQVGIESATINIEASTSTAVATQVTIDATGITNTDVYTNTEAGSLSATVSANNATISGAAVTWSSSNTDVATINENGVVTLVAAGNTTITAAYAGVEGQYLPSSATYTLEVTDSTPFTGGDVTFVCGEDMSGTMSLSKNGVTMVFESSGGTWNRTDNYRLYSGKSMTISTSNGTITSIAFEISQNNFSGDGYNAETKIWTGNAETITLAADGGQVRFTPVVVTVNMSGTPDPVITADNVSIEFGATAGEITYAIANPVEGATIVPELASGATISNFSLDDETISPISFTCDANNTTTARTATVTLNYVKNGETLATKDVTITQAAAPETLTTMQAIFNKASNLGSNGGSVNVVFNNWVVSGVSGSTAFVTDNEGKGFMIFKSEHGFEVNDVLSGTVYGTSLKLYKGAAEFTTLTSQAEGLTISKNGSVTMQYENIENLGGVNTGALITLSTLTYSSDDAMLTDNAGNSIKPYNTLYSGMLFTDGHTYDVSGIYQQFDNTKEILPRSAEDITEAQFSIYLNQPIYGNNTISADYEYAPAGTTVTLTAELEDGYTLFGWNVRAYVDGTQIEEIEVVDNRFVMPAYDVTVEALIAMPCTLRLYCNGGMIYETQDLSVLEEIPEEALWSCYAPEGYEVVGWTASPQTMELIEFPYPLTSDYVDLYSVLAESDPTSSALTIDANTENFPSSYGSETECMLNGRNFNVYQAYVNGQKLQFKASLGYIYNVEDFGKITSIVLNYNSSDTKKNFTITAGSAINPYDIQIEPTINELEYTFDLSDGDYHYFALRNGENAGYLNSIVINYGESGLFTEVIVMDESSTWYPLPNNTLESWQRLVIKDGAFVQFHDSDMSNGTAANIIIEDGGQFISYNPIEATVRKSILGCNYNSNNNSGYYLIATPLSSNFSTISPYSVKGMLSNEYDLYAYDNREEYEWRNFKDSESYFTSMYLGEGYLYANSQDVTLEFAGSLTPAYDEESFTTQVQNPGFNLVGNPFTFNVTTTIDHMVLNSEGSGFEVSSGEIKPCEAILVETTLSDEEVTLSRQSRNVSSVTMNVMKERGTVIDNARVRFGEGQGMNKFYLNENSTRIFIAQGNDEKAVAYSAAQGEMPVSFRASENGTYTIAVEAENVDMNYLHLIDNMTGADVDLLATPNYTFEARTNDYTSRFRLVFSANGIDEQNAEAFAFFNGTSWTVSNTGDATLQVVDITGRIISSETINGNATVSLNQPAGIYMLRLVNGNDVKVQKVVVR